MIKFQKGDKVVINDLSEHHHDLMSSSWYSRMTDKVMTVKSIQDSGNRILVYESSAIWLSHWLRPYIDDFLEKELFEI